VELSIKTKIIRRIAFYNYFNSRNQKSVNRFPFLSRSEIEVIRLNKLKNISYNAIKTVPFYKNLGIDIDFSKFSLEDLKKFPVVNKEIIRENPKLFLSNTKRGYASQTSGSTGVPFEYYLPYRSGALELMTVNRAWGMGEVPYKYGDPVVQIRSYSPKPGEALVKHDISNNYYYISPFHLNENYLHEYLEFITNSQAKILRGYPSSIYIFTLLLMKCNIKLNQVKSIITSSETLLPIWREIIEGFWGVKILDWYGQNENTVTVQQCLAGNYHNNDDYGYLELDKENSIIATSLINDVMPFIRYDTRDVAVPLGETIESCPCGRKTSIPFKAIEGRKDDILVTNDGTLIPTANFSTAFKKFSELNQFQIIQELDRSLKLNLVIRRDIELSYIDKIKAELSQRLGTLDIQVNITDKIERDLNTGKVKVVVQKTKL
jgi:phenylacetate-CoA ligase